MWRKKIHNYLLWGHIATHVTGECRKNRVKDFEVCEWRWQVTSDKWVAIKIKRNDENGNGQV